MAQLQQCIRRPAPVYQLLNKGVRKASDLNAGEYGMFVSFAGFASVYDYPGAKGLQAVAEDVWDRGGIVAAACHGGAIFPGIKDPKTGKSIMAGKDVTGFSTEGGAAPIWTDIAV